MNENMRYDWIEIAMEHGGELTSCKTNKGYRSTMGWAIKGCISGDFQTTLPDSLNSLNTALEDDAADECQC